MKNLHLKFSTVQARLVEAIEKYKTVETYAEETTAVVN